MGRVLPLPRAKTLPVLSREESLAIMSDCLTKVYHIHADRKSRTGKGHLVDSYRNTANSTKDGLVTVYMDQLGITC